MASTADRPIVLITGASGNLGGSIAAALRERYQIVGLDRSRAQGRDDPMLEIDLTEDDSVAAALRQVGERYGKRLAAVIHLVAYFDSSGEDHPLYQAVNVDGTRRLLRALRGFDVQRFIYAGTMLVHKPGKPGQAIDETQPFGPQYIYPKSKLQAEEIIRSERGPMPYAILRLAGVYDERVVVPTLANQIARIYERDLQSHFYPASPLVGQSMLHRDDMVDAFVRTVDRRSELPDAAEMLIGEPEPLGYDALQDEIGYLIHGQEDWPTLRLPKAIAAAGGVSLPWNLWAAVAVGAWLMFTRITLGTDGAMANAEHLVGAVALTVLSVAAAEPARAARLLLVPLAAGLLAAALSLGEDPFAMAVDAVAAVALAALGVRRGPIRARYGKWDRMII